MDRERHLCILIHLDSRAKKRMNASRIPEWLLNYIEERFPHLDWIQQDSPKSNQLEESILETLETTIVLYKPTLS